MKAKKSQLSLSSHGVLSYGLYGRGLRKEVGSADLSES
jgi:hypothetical protein